MSLVIVNSPHGVRASIERLCSALEQRGVGVFARVDHGGGARAAGLELADEEVVIFGDPRVGTLLMQSDPRIGYELPLRVLAWDAAGQTMLAYRPPSELLGEYDVGEQASVLEGMTRLLEQITNESARP